ncbi:MAG: cobalamin ABC transporter substrate-binding protein, partial [Alphaproteobacteria bacterium]|nr:cobalamin ABC transporter substrate-binding protein [Alphaproteobacteria bacterium]
MGALVVIGLVMSQPASAGDLPRVASMSLCSDQLVLLLAEPDQIQSVHWVSQDEADSYLAAEARRYPAN